MANFAIRALFFPGVLPKKSIIGTQYSAFIKKIQKGDDDIIIKRSFFFRYREGRYDHRLSVRYSTAPGIHSGVESKDEKIKVDTEKKQIYFDDIVFLPLCTVFPPSFATFHSYFFQTLVRFGEGVKTLDPSTEFKIATVSHSLRSFEPRLFPVKGKQLITRILQGCRNG